MPGGLDIQIRRGTRTTVLVLCTCMLWTILTGCEPQQSMPDVSSDTQQDLLHEHTHLHGKGHDHEHDHTSGYEGSHDHPHEHGHRHGEPLHGGKIFAIEHTRHTDEETHYHVEVLPINSGQVVLYFLEEDAGRSIEHPLEVRRIAANANSPQSADDDQPVEFVAVSEPPSAQFVCALPDSLQQYVELDVVMPAVEIGEQRLIVRFQCEAVQADQ